ncbi:hypothetical protein RHCRD62_20712 [Rhodococcus sp. RD6.2]|nr:hypothetical protein RHCRD62_20712 [Rhodococcus sp. RD6.2]
MQVRAALPIVSRDGDELNYWTAPES